MKTLVMKFGGAAVGTPEQFSHIAELIIARRKEYPRIVVVVSAMGKTTDELISLAKKVHPNPPQREYDMLISVGERISMTLLAMALCLKGEEAKSFTGSQSGIITCGNHAQAQIIDVRPHRLEAALKEGKIVIVAGFQGVSTDKEITTLGRGGSDTSAVALGLALNAEKIEFYKDVPAMFDVDPKVDPNAECYKELPYQEALEIVNRGAKILHGRALLLAKKNGIPLHVRSFLPHFQDHPGTVIAEAGIEKRKTALFESSEAFVFAKRSEHEMHNIFIHRNEEEVMRNILTLSEEIKYVKDLPQVIIHFDEQGYTHLYFTVILARLSKPEEPSLAESFKKTDSRVEYLHDRTKATGFVRKKYPKEVSVFRLKIRKDDFLRTDQSIDLYKARQAIVKELSKVLGTFRDYNGGIIAKQLELLSEIRHALGDIDKNEDLLLENFFYSLAPVVAKALIDPMSFRTLFAMLLQGLKEFGQMKHYLKFHSDNQTHYALTIVQEYSIKDAIHRALHELNIPSKELACAHVKIDGYLCLGYLCSTKNREKQEQFCKTISQFF